MTRAPLLIALVAIAAAAFLAGAYTGYHSRSEGGKGERKVLHWVDPMHPSYTSDKPGIAPDCGMPLEPVFADGKGGGEKPPQLPPGTVEVAAASRQLFGVKVAPVERTGGGSLLRLQGRVAPDELRTYIVNSTIDGWITSVGNNTTGSLVKKDQVLATFYSSEFLSAGQALLYALTSMERAQGGTITGQAQKDQMQQFGLGLKQYRDSLKNLGMGDRQIDRMIATRKYMENVEITAPGDGIVLVRNVSQGLRFERGRELYRISDLSRVWILVDTYGADAELFRPGDKVRARLPHQGKEFTARVANVLPQFDPESRTLKVRLEAENPGYLLRPEMFVDVELPVRYPDVVAVPAEAVLDSGLKKTVFVENGEGIYQPRPVTTGRNFGGRVEIVSGLVPGERIVVSGTFLVDSESKMKTAAAGIGSEPRLDPVCRMYVDEERARSAGLFVEGRGETFFFCSPDCRNRFAAASPLPGKGSAAKTGQGRGQAHAAAAKPAPSRPDSPEKGHEAEHRHD